MTLVGGSLNCAIGVALNGTFEWTAGALSGPLGISPGSILNLTGAFIKEMIVGAEINNSGTVNWTGGVGGYLRGDNNCTVNNLAGATYNVASDGSPFENYYGGNVFNNAGVFIKTGGVGTATVHAWTFKNTSQIVANSGSIVFDGGEVDLNNGGLVMGLTEVHFSGAGVVLRGTTTCVGHGVFDGGGLAGHADGTGTLAGGRWDWAAGTWSGVINVAPFTNVILVGNAGRDLQTGAMLENYGTITVQGGGNLRGINNCRFNNHAGAVFSAASLPFVNYYGGNVFTNDGTVIVGSPLGIWPVDWDFTQSATGQLRIDIGGLTPGTQFDRVAFSGAVTLGGTLSVSMANSFVPAVGNSFAVLTYSNHSGTFAKFNIMGATFSRSYNANDLTLTATNSPTNFAEWKAAYFDPGSPDAASNADPDHDGISNLMEYATGGNPHNPSTNPTTFTPPVGGFAYFTYTRSKVALNDLQFQVEYGDLSGAWSHIGVTEHIDSDDDIMQQVTAKIPVGPVSDWFAHLLVTGP